MKRRKDHIQFFCIRKLFYSTMNNLFGGIRLFAKSSESHLWMIRNNEEYSKKFYYDNFRCGPLIKLPMKENEIYKLFMDIDLHCVSIDFVVAHYSVMISDYATVLEYSEMLLAVLEKYPRKISLGVLEDTLNLIDYRMYCLSKGYSDSEMRVLKTLHNIILNRISNKGYLKNWDEM